MDFRSDNPYFYCIPTRNISDKFTTIRDLFRFLQPGLISSTTFDEKLGFPTGNHKRIPIYKLIMDLIPNNWKHFEAFQKSFLKTLYYENKRTRLGKWKTSKISITNKFASLFNLIVLNTKNVSNSFHSQTSLKDTIFSVLKFGVNLLLIGLGNTQMNIYFLTLQYIEWATHQIFCVSLLVQFHWLVIM